VPKGDIYPVPGLLSSPRLHRQKFSPTRRAANGAAPAFLCSPLTAALSPALPALDVALSHLRTMSLRARAGACWRSPEFGRIGGVMLDSFLSLRESKLGTIQPVRGGQSRVWIGFGISFANVSGRFLVSSQRLAGVDEVKHSAAAALDVAVSKRRRDDQSLVFRPAETS
jgi:hypothetical protein